MKRGIAAYFLGKCPEKKRRNSGVRFQRARWNFGTLQTCPTIDEFLIRNPRSLFFSRTGASCGPPRRFYNERGAFSHLDYQAEQVCASGCETSAWPSRRSAQGMYITLWYFLQTYRRKAFTQQLRVSRAAGAGEAALPRLPSLRPDDVHRLRQVCPRLPGRLHLHREDQEPGRQGVPRQRLQDRLHQVHVLRLVRRSVPGRLHLHGFDATTRAASAATAASSISPSCRSRRRGARRRSTRRPSPPRNWPSSRSGPSRPIRRPPPRRRRRRWRKLNGILPWRPKIRRRRNITLWPRQMRPCRCCARSCATSPN